MEVSNRNKMKYSRDWLKQQVQKGEAIKYFFFWGHKQQNPTVTDKSCLSQWFPAAFTVDGILYPTAEHWMMIQKAKLFKDEEALSKMLNTSKPGTAKALGRTVKDFDKAVWDEKAYHLVVEGNIHKFSQHESMRTFLLNTGNKVIVEASPRDFIWGIGLGQDRKEAMDPNTWRGSNWLGFALMEVRDELLKQNT
jgi:ribA/ribD-fused uncharacterized protein